MGRKFCLSTRRKNAERKKRVPVASDAGGDVSAVEACVLVVSIPIHYLEFIPAPSLCVLRTWIESLHILPQGNTLINPIQTIF